jgi:hypothetical protein
MDEVKEDNLTADQLGLIACAIRHGPFPPRPEYLADCHRLHERGWFDLRVTDEAVLFGLSDRCVTAMELGVPLGDANESVN